MPEGSQSALRRFFVDRYDVLLRALTRRLGSRDLASDTLHDTYLRLERGSNIGPVHDPQSYLLRMASNVAAARRVKEVRRATEPDETVVQNAVDEAPGPEQIASGKSEWDRLLRALGDIPARRREIFLAAWVDEEPYDQLATRYGVGIRTIQLEVKKAFEYCACALEKEN